MEISREQLQELTEVIEDTVEYACDQYLDVRRELALDQLSDCLSDCKAR